MFKFKPAPDALPPQCGIENYFALQKFTFKCLGIDITSEQRTIFNPILTRIQILVLAMHCILMLLYAAECRNDINLMTDILAPCCQSTLVLIKMVCFLWNKKKIVKLVRHIWLRNLKAAAGKEFEIILEENEKEQYISLLFSRYVLATLITACLSPFFVSYIFYLQGHRFMDNLELPLKAAYHIVLDPKTHHGYVLAYIFNVVALWFDFKGGVGNDILFSWCAHNITAQFRIINLRFKTAARARQTQDDESIFKGLIISNIEYHRGVIELANNFSYIFKVTVFVKFTISFLEVACLIFQINRDGQLSTLALHVLFLMSVSLQLMIYCRGGQMIRDESTSIAGGIYEQFQWHNMSVKSKQLLLLVMMRAWKPCILTGIFFVADLPTLQWIFKTAGSLYTMLNSVES